MTTDPVRRLMEFGRNLEEMPLSRIPESFNKVAFLCVNSYESFRFGLGKGPLEDAVRVAKMAKAMGYEIYFMKAPHCRNFFPYFDRFLQRSHQHLLMYYVGHEVYKSDLTGDKTLKEEAFLFDDGHITDADVIQHIVDNKQPECQLTLMTDSCHPGSIWDIDEGQVCGIKLPPGILSIAASNIFKPGQKTINIRMTEGIFTDIIMKAIKENPDITPQQLEDSLKNKLKEVGQEFVVGSSSPEILNRPFLERPSFD